MTLASLRAWDHFSRQIIIGGTDFTMLQNDGQNATLLSQTSGAVVTWSLHYCSFSLALRRSTNTVVTWSLHYCSILIDSAWTNKLDKHTN